MGCMLGYIMNHESTNDKKWCKNSQQDGSCMGRKMGEKAIRVLLGHQCRSHDKPRGGWSPMLPWCGFCLQIWQPQIGQICKNHMLKPSKTGCMSRPWGIVHRGENSDSKTWPKTKKKNIKLHEVCENSAENSLEIHDCHWSIFGFPKVCKNTFQVSFDPPHLPCDVRFAPPTAGHMQPIHRQNPWVGKSPMVWKIIVPCALPLEILLPNPLFWMGFHDKKWEGLSLPNPNIIFSSKRQVSGKKSSGFGAAWRLKTYSESKNLMFFSMPQGPQVWEWNIDSITKTSLYITKLGYLAKIEFLAGYYMLHVCFTTDSKRLMYHSVFHQGWPSIW